jgi:hypothetical protein
MKRDREGIKDGRRKDRSVTEGKKRKGGGKADEPAPQE